MSAASSSPPIEPSNQPASATRRVNQQAASIALSTVGEPAADVSGWSTRCPIVHTCGMATSSVRGSRLAPRHVATGVRDDDLHQLPQGGEQEDGEQADDDAPPDAPATGTPGTGTGAVRSGASVVARSVMRWPRPTSPARG